ncbi:MAG: hypothetical protein U9Q81_18130 [Pseudomonadota bacterium]|nr:hypothetical protein [Pseudomonadota bacterium]
MLTEPLESFANRAGGDADITETSQLGKRKDLTPSFAFHDKMLDFELTKPATAVNETNYAMVIQRIPIWRAYSCSLIF